MISVVQIKAARSMLGWSAVKLAEKSGCSPVTVKRYELQDGIPAANTSVLLKIKECLENHGIEFTGDPLTNPGVVYHIRK